MTSVELQLGQVTGAGQLCQYKYTKLPKTSSSSRRIIYKSKVLRNRQLVQVGENN